MSDIIQVLPDSVANQIAAGEVIQRPASVVKELVENAIDAGATTVNVLTVDSGRTSIQVIDNGKGMSETDARLSFERHATSKIRKAADLFDLHTMGFRGEALASIAAVAQVELKTRQPGEEVGTHLSLAGSKVVGQEACACPVGSNFMIENLFYNVPVRRKFLKSNATELTNITTAFERIALVNPDVTFTLQNNGSEMFSLKASGLRQRIVDIFGKKINQSLLPVEVTTSLCKISGFVGKPESARKKGAQQYFFVNGRYMKHPYFNKAVMTAYDRLIPAGEQVPYFLYFEVEPENIDVNIHPTKTEIKFENEQAIWQIVAAAVKESVGMFNDVTAIDFDTQDCPDIPLFDPDNVSALPKVKYNPEYNPFRMTDAPSAPVTPSATVIPSAVSDPSAKTSVEGWEQLYEGLGRDADPQTQLFNFDEVGSGIVDSHLNSVASAPTDDAAAPSDIIPSSVSPLGETVSDEKSPAHYQYKGKYIMTAVKSGLMIVDQHRAHLRIRYEAYLTALRNKKTHSQKVLFPEALHFSASENVVLEKILPELETIGFELTDLGACSYALGAVPEGLEGLDYVSILQDIVSSSAETRTSAIDEINHDIALGLARHAAIGYGEVLSNDEMENIVNSLFACSNFNYTPDGKKIIGVLRQTEIEHLFS